MNSNSTQNQAIKRKFVEREVIYCVSMLVYELAQKADEFPEYSDDLYSAFIYTDYEDTVEAYIQTMDQKECLDYLSVKIIPEDDEMEALANKPLPQLRTDVLNVAIDQGFEEFCDEMVAPNNGEFVEREIFEHWIVSDYLADQLESHGHKVMRDFFGLTVWCRPTTGQGILLDGVISEICADMGILEGQENEWSV